MAFACFEVVRAKKGEAEVT